MTQTIAPAEPPAAESPHLARPHTDAAARRAIEEATAHLHEMAKQQIDLLNGQQRILAILDNFASNDMPGRQRHIEECVDQMLAKVNGTPAAG